MAKRKLDTNIREDIIRASKQLFYEKGYKDTYYQDICNKVGISPGTFYYYFRSKDNIAGIIIDELSNKIESFLEEYHGDKLSLEAIYILQCVIYYDLLYKNTNFKRYYIELCETNILNKSTIDTTYNFTKKYYEKYRPTDDSRYIKALSYVFSYTQSAIFYPFFNNELELSYNEVVELAISIIFSMLFKQDQNQVINLIRSMRMEAEKISCEITNDFEIQCRFK